MPLVGKRIAPPFDMHEHEADEDVSSDYSTGADYIFSYIQPPITYQEYRIQGRITLVFTITGS